MATWKRQMIKLVLSCGIGLCLVAAAKANAEDIRDTLVNVSQARDMVGLERICKSWIETESSKTDDVTAIVYEYLGVAQYNLGRLKEATATFETTVAMFPNHTDAYMHLGDCYLSQLLVPEAIQSFEIALTNNPLKAGLYSRLFKARKWVANWTDHDILQDTVQAMAIASVEKGEMPAVAAADLGALPLPLLLDVSKLGLYSQPKDVLLCCDVVESTQKLKVGFVSSDFGVHPVSTLVRGLMTMLPSPSFEVFGFALSDESSWWRANISSHVDYMVSLNGMNKETSARKIHDLGIHILIDLNGHTLGSGLPILSHRPAPVQMSFLGYPLTTGSPFIDYFLVDPISSPPMDVHLAFSEKMIFLPRNYIVNDYKQIVQHVLKYDRPTRWDAKLYDVPRTAFVFATFSNWQKMDPSIFDTWMHILRRVPNSVMWFMKYAGFAAARKNLIAEAKKHGVDGKTRFFFTQMTPWINHTWVKQAADLVLDTSLKNGHTTMVDALWAGVPIVTIQGDRMSNRAASSAVASIGDRMYLAMVTHSFKEYEELAVTLAKSPLLLQRLRHDLESKRVESDLFDTIGFIQLFGQSLLATWDIRRISITRRISPHPSTSFHVVVPSTLVKSGQPEAQSETAPLLLHIGGLAHREGWSIVNIEPMPFVDFVRDMKDLHGLEGATAIYSSHTLEHCAYGVDTNEVGATLAEWFRVLKPGGALFLSVPDLSVLAELFIDPSLTSQEKYHVMRMIYGGQTDAHDYHKVGFDYDILNGYLTAVGFCSIKRVSDFGLFTDSSRLVFKNRAISLNVIAKACKPGNAISVELPNV
ncbi:unnamed protein product [Aphanomyces euteiches]|uniref:protein O-GlcNAc transferase n=1 Tax=Aphanomyces euteiches TaxID=100861 RepID=A0A6G0X272_9STRA|nr:hypothetical protein Ae201684_009478 [Aphanomyces euteiches]KAH9136212.1 hypothetical protein AeRB84_018543 [Aphanomyces euteiches]